MLGYGDLYDQFDLDADWDAPQNLKLIGQMPKEYLTDGVTDEGKTSIHMLGGLKTPFAGKDPVNFRDIKDGTEYTVMLVQAGPDKADVWTKPGTLGLKPEAIRTRLLLSQNTRSFAFREGGNGLRRLEPPGGAFRGWSPGPSGGRRDF